EPIVARPVGKLERVVKWVRRKPAVAALLAAVVLVTLLGVGGIYWKDLDAEEQKEITEGQMRFAQEQTRIARAKTRQAQEAAKEAREKSAEEKKARDQAEWLVYSGRLHLIQREWQDNNFGVAQTLLASIRPDWRGNWEYGYLWRLCNGNHRIIRAHTG